MAGLVQPKGYQSSGLMTASSTIKSSSGRVGGVTLIASGTNEDVTLILYDHVSTNSGTELAKVHLSSTMTEDWRYQPLPDVVFSAGCFAAMTNGNYIVHFS